MFDSLPSKGICSSIETPLSISSSSLTSRLPALRSALDSLTQLIFLAAQQKFQTALVGIAESLLHSHGYSISSLVPLLRVCTLSEDPTASNKYSQSTHDCRGNRCSTRRRTSFVHAAQYSTDLVEQIEELVGSEERLQALRKSLEPYFVHLLLALSD